MSQDWKSIHNAKTLDAGYMSSFDPALGPKPSVRRLAEMLSSGASVFEYGVGQGANAFFLAERGLYVAAQDVSDVMIERFRIIMWEKGLNIPVFESAAQDYEPNCSYDAFVCTYLLHFLPPSDALRVIATMQSFTHVGGYHAIELFTINSGDYVQPDRYYPDVTDFLALYDDWEAIESKVWIKEGGQTGRTERLTAVFRKVR